MKNRKQGWSRNVLKFDALILGVAAAQKADAILTTDGSDFQKLATALGEARLGDGHQVPRIVEMDKPLPGKQDLFDDAKVVELADRRKR